MSVLLDDERLEPLGKNMKIVVSDSHPFGTDAILLADFADIHKGDRVCDLGTGCGIIPLLWYKGGKAKHISAVDIQPKACAQLEKSLEINGTIESGEAMPITLSYPVYIKECCIKENSFVTVNTDNLRYDVSKMKSIRGFYLPNVSDKDNITKDVLQINDYLLQAMTLVKIFPNLQISANDIEFKFDKVLPDEPTEFCTFIYTPNTPTGKASKYPLKLGFYCRRTNNIQGEIEYLQNGEIGKARIIIWHKGTLYLVHILDKKGIKAITKIETTNKNGERITIYNANKKEGE